MSGSTGNNGVVLIVLAIALVVLLLCSSAAMVLFWRPSSSSSPSSSNANANANANANVVGGVANATAAGNAATGGGGGVTLHPVVVGTASTTTTTTTSSGAAHALPWNTANAVYTANATYYGPDQIHGIVGGNDNIFQHIPASQYSAAQLNTIGSNFCAMTQAFLQQGFMGKIIRATGTKATRDMVVVDYLPDRNDGKNVQIDVQNETLWLDLGGDPNIGMTMLTFEVVGQASIPVPSDSPWDPKKFGF